jgi:hypothetical protein
LTVLLISQKFYFLNGRKYFDHPFCVKNVIHSHQSQMLLELTYQTVLVSYLRSHGTRGTHAQILPEEQGSEGARRCAPHQHAQDHEVGGGTETAGKELLKVE